jgi:hypothetical protein
MKFIDDETLEELKRVLEDLLSEDSWKEKWVPNDSVSWRTYCLVYVGARTEVDDARRMLEKLYDLEGV